MTDRELELLKLVSLIKSNGDCQPAMTPLIETCEDCPLSDNEGTV